MQFWSVFILLALLSCRSHDNSFLVYWTFYQFSALVRSLSWYRTSMNWWTLGSPRIRHLFQPIRRVFGWTFYSSVREGLESDSRHVGRPSQACRVPICCYSRGQLLALRSSGHRTSGHTLDVIALSLCGLLHYRGIRIGQRVREHFPVGVSWIASDYCCWKKKTGQNDTIVTCPCLLTM